MEEEIIDIFVKIPSNGVEGLEGDEVVEGQTNDKFAELGKLFKECPNYPDDADMNLPKCQELEKMINDMERDADDAAAQSMEQAEPYTNY